MGISRCLLGQRVRYDGGHALAPWITQELGEVFKWIPLCPETGCGLPVPREPIRLEGDMRNPRVVGVTSRTDYLPRLLDWTETMLLTLRRERICGLILKSKSPSCAAREKIRVYDHAGRTVGKSLGIFARAAAKAFPDLPVEDELRLRSELVRRDFVAKTFRYPPP